MNSISLKLAPPLALMAEITHRCPLQCPYCSNPLELLKITKERDTSFWLNLIDQAADLGVLQIHFSGGEPTLRRDLPELIAHATKRGLYTNLITSAVLLDESKLTMLEQSGLAHVQISFQGATPSVAEHIGNYTGAQSKKIEIAQLVTKLGMSLTVNAVVHRQNLHELSALIDLAIDLDADRLEIAHVQYHGWALRNRAALMPTREQFEAADLIVSERRDALRGKMIIDYVVPDYYATTPKTCMGGWGQKLINITPDGRVLPCHAAESIPGLTFERAVERPLKDIWQVGSAFEKFRGTGWMLEPCASCAFKEVDWGGCRCQAFAITGNANNADPVCYKSPHHESMNAMAMAESLSDRRDYIYRKM